MRTPRYRGKDLKTGEWVYGYFCKQHIPDEMSEGQYQTAYVIFNDEPGHRHKGGYWHEVHYNSVGENTGMNDRNQTAIYEGDILRLTIPDGTVRHFVVEWAVQQRHLASLPDFIPDGNPVEITGWCFNWHGNRLLPSVIDGVSDCFRMEIIGNVFDNPEQIDADLKED